MGCLADGGITKLANMLIYILLYMATLFVNKYVLSMLNFTYPTIFQGWQSLVGACLLRILIYTGRINVDLSQITRSRVLPWMPGMILHVLSIYSGSIALSKMTVPAFVCHQNLVLIFSFVTGDLIQKKVFLGLKSVLLFILLSSSIFISITDPQFEKRTYMWMAAHIASSGAMAAYQNVFSSNISLGEVEKVYLNYIYSFAVLLPCTYFLGDAMAVQRFEFWYYHKFYIGCLLSGVFGALLCLFTITLSAHSPLPPLTVTDIVGMAKIAAAGISLLLFPFIVTARNVPWILVNLSAGMLLVATENQDDADLSLIPTKEEEEDNRDSVNSHRSAKV